MDVDAVDLTGFFNNLHRQWSIPCEICSNCASKNKDDASIEIMLRLSITYKLKIEEDRFNSIFDKFPNIVFNLAHKESFLTKSSDNDDISFDNENDLVEFFLSQKFIIGVSFNIEELIGINESPTSFVIPILKGGKMWKMLMANVSNVNIHVWRNFVGEPLECLFCKDYPRDLYPGNFVVNQSILFMKSFIWVDKRRIHCKVTKRMDNKRGKLNIKRDNTENVSFIMYNGSTVVSWPFLKEHFNIKTVRDEVTTLNNMAIYSMGDIFISFIEILLLRLFKAKIQNEIIQKLKPFYNTCNVTFKDLNLHKFDLMNMYKNCKRKKRYEFDDGNTNLKLKKNCNKSPDEVEDMLINVIRGELPLDDIQITCKIIKWLHYPRALLIQASIINNISQMLKRGEIDMAISQTSVLDKDYVIIKHKPQSQNQDAPSIMGTNNRLDVHRIGRFTRNAPTNSYYNICGIASAMQKVLTKDSRTTKPKYIAKDEIGFIDLITTADTPKNSGLILESVIDCFISSSSNTATWNMAEILLKLFPSCEKVPFPGQISELDCTHIYICANQVLYRIEPSVPRTLTQRQLEYIERHPFYSTSYYHLTQYALKVLVPFIELIEQTHDKFWICTSQSRNIYKLHVDGLFYSPKEWLDKNMSFATTFNIFGPSIRSTPFPINGHLPRVGHAAYTAKNFIGIPSNTLSVGELHQKSQYISFYAEKTYSSEIIKSPGWFPKILIAGGFNNQEDGIAIRRGALDSGKFSSVSYETATLKLIYSNNQTPSHLSFVPLIQKSHKLRLGLAVGYFKLSRNNSAIDFDKYYHQESFILSVEIFSPELTMKAFQSTKEGDRVISLEKEKKICIDFHELEKWILYVYWNGSSDEYRCEKIRCDNLAAASHFKIYLFYASVFIPSIGDKLQTMTSNKGVITEIIDDQDMPYILDVKNKLNIIPDLIVNPFFLKRQTLDNILMTGYFLSGKTEKGPFMNNCFSFTMEDAKNYIVLGDEYASGYLMNAITGLPFIKPKTIVNNKTSSDNPRILDYKYREFIDEDGFRYMTKNTNPTPHEIVKGSIYRTRYFVVNNHRASAMLQCSNPDEVKRTEFCGTPVRGKKGGFATGLQEQLAFIGMGATRFNTEISQIRSETCNLPVFKSQANEDPLLPNSGAAVISSSNTFKRAMDELIQSNIDIALDITQHKKIIYKGSYERKN